jgi:argininosuccinate lyase
LGARAYDIAGSHAHAAALAAAGYLTADEEARMHAGLDALAAAIADGSLVAQPTDEDVHGALEAALIAEIGPALGGKPARVGAATIRSPLSCGCTCSTTPA